MLFNLVILVILVIVAVIWWFFPLWQRQRQESSPGSTLTAKDLAELEDQYRKTCTQALGSIVVLLTVFVAYRQLEQTEANSREQIKQVAEKTALDNSNEQLAKGYELIGANTAAQRAGGIHLLMQWAEQSGEAVRKPRLELVAKTLVNLVRDRTRFEKDQLFTKCESFETKRPIGSMIGSDIQQALDGLVEISKEIDGFSVNFHGLNLSGAKLIGGRFKDSNFAFADLSDAELEDVDLRDSDFYCSNMFRAKFLGAELTGTSLNVHEPQTNMAGAVLREAFFSKGSKSKGSKPASLKKVNLVSAVLDEARIEDVDMSGADLSNAKLDRTHLIRATLDETIVDTACYINVDLVETTLKNTKQVRLLDPVREQSSLWPACSVIHD
jgi:uncharacterized protein YjbI with pentapeptide repeats